ncbi:1-deoxy-D-xylulose-5-phosphate reductoisomerase [Salidesulfovibrio brasiliensis]|uniref:1-deoxy-D-xylulose-5-phosphate reductoisomerase n=1 Tax=Salidesulfovibrio brasiliensis TaxID=221711 RepID=UPI0006CF24ED|nr:1-deoxy-D-xylulose-5-phosphate reductoisomerase [Salidesulfovibrio brasiliensis]
MKTYISRWPESLDLPDFPRGLSVLGSTGSIGVSALDVVRKHPGRFKVLALAGGRNAQRLAEQAAEFRPAYLAILDDKGAEELRKALPSGYAPEILTGPSAYEQLAALDEADLVLSTIVGAAGFMPTLAAAKAGKIIALANKESLVLGGHIIRRACADSGAIILPVDSEHNALFQGLMGHGEDTPIKKLILTASGGPFRGRCRADLESVTLAQALDHPNWDMGAKITIDSSTLMNKGLEVIEACHLYGLPVGQVDVVVHPQSIIHSLVEYVDGSQLAHLGLPDMRIPIAHCLCFPDRVPLDMPSLDLAALGSLTFEKPDYEAFPCLKLAFEAFAAGESHPIVLNAANEVAVDLFLKERIRYLDIPAIIEAALASHTTENVADPEAALALDAQTRKKIRTSH